MHYGIKRKSGRYPWGSGRDAYGRSRSFYAMIDDLKNGNPKIPETEIAKAMGLSVADLRATKTIAKEVIVQEQTQRAVTLKEKGVSLDQIAKDLGIPQPTVRLRLKNADNIQQSKLSNTVDAIRAEVDKHKIVDVGKGVDLTLGIADTKLNAALSVLRDEGYETYNLQTRNVGTSHFTNQRVIVPPGTGFGGAKKMQNEIHTMGKWTENDGLTFFGIHDPLSVNSSRIQVVHNSQEDGTVYIRPGVKDLDMGKNTYAQVRIMVDGTHFIKGVAVLNPDLPKGVDIQVHSNKGPEVGKIGALKPIKDDPDNPFGSMIKRQIVELDSKGNERVKSALNLVNEEGDWEDWRKSVPSQMLAKQPHSLIKSQLQTTRDDISGRLAEIDKITNPVVRKKAYEDFADKVDSDAVDLRAAAFPRQRTQVIIPMTKMNKGEIYAPNFETGERVVLIRYPHGGRFEIPEVTVNNNNRTAKRLLGNAVDAIGIHPSVAERLSGADFDGDTVIVIPNRSGKIKGVESMGSQRKVYDDALNNFNPKDKYGGFVKSGTDKNGNEIGNFKLMRNTGKEMGVITNLITDMQVQGAKPEHIVRAVKHSMVVIDAEKHKLNYKQSEIDNNIAQLKELYQSHPGTDKRPGGATTLLSRATAKERVPEFKDRPAKEGGRIDPETGAIVTVPTGRTRSVFDKKTGTYTDEKVLVTTEAKRLALTNDAHTLVRDKADPVERLYAEHANAMKALANQARLKAVRTPNPKINPQARTVYKNEVDRLTAALRRAQAQKPLDRRADVIAGAVVKQKLHDDPTLRYDSDRKKKVERQAKSAARARLGLEKPVIEISDREWDAIQSGAVSSSRLRDILSYADPKRVTELAMPRTNPVMTTAITARAKAMLSAGNSAADVAAALGIPVSTLRGAALRGDL
jgi:hypothetical protein